MTNTLYTYFLFFLFWSAKGEKQRRKIRVFVLRVLDLLEVCWTNDCAATAAEKPPWVGSGGSARLSPLSLLHFLAFPPSRSENCRTNKVYRLQSTPGESVESTITSNFSTFISRFAFPDETRDVCEKSLASSDNITSFLREYYANIHILTKINWRKHRKIYFKTLVILTFSHHDPSVRNKNDTKDNTWNVSKRENLIKMRRDTPARNFMRYANRNRVRTVRILDEAIRDEGSRSLLY